ncbi:MAG TPA: hypothetical protein VFN68_03760 [Acidimicrobiales bacterium]|nr:hypothetical protein [Acidimicrobiales bacterium]
MRLTEIWRATVPGHTSHTVLADPGSKSLFVSDGWGVAYPALRLHRLDPETGEQLAEIRTRQQHVSALVAAQDSLFVATHSRLLRLRPGDLGPVGHWDKVLPSDSQQLVALGDRLIAANWRKPVVGLFEVGTGTSVRLRVGLQPLLLRHGDGVSVVEGFDGSRRPIDLERGRLLGAEPGPPVTAVAAGTDIWGVAAGEPADGGGGAPSTWLKPAADRLLRLSGEGRWEALLAGPGMSVHCDDERGLVWCLVGPGPSTLVAVSQEYRWSVASFNAGPGRYWAYFDPTSGLAVAVEAVEAGGGYRSPQAASTLIGHLVVSD